MRVRAREGRIMVVSSFPSLEKGCEERVAGAGKMGEGRGKATIGAAGVRSLSREDRRSRVYDPPSPHPTPTPTPPHTPRRSRRGTRGQEREGVAPGRARAGATPRRRAAGGASRAPERRRERGQAWSRPRRGTAGPLCPAARRAPRPRRSKRARGRAADASFPAHARPPKFLAGARPQGEQPVAEEEVTLELTTDAAAAPGLAQTQLI